MYTEKEIDAICAACGWYDDNNYYSGVRTTIATALLFARQNENTSYSANTFYLAEAARKIFNGKD